jgi:hypothetical protein
MLANATFTIGYQRGAAEMLGALENAQKSVCQSKSNPIPSISLREAKKAIKAYFEEHHGEAIDYTDLMDHLEIPLPIIVKACEALEREGKIAGVD